MCEREEGLEFDSLLRKSQYDRSSTLPDLWLDYSGNYTNLPVRIQEEERYWVRILYSGCSLVPKKRPTERRPIRENIPSIVVVLPNKICINSQTPIPKQLLVVACSHTIVSPFPRWSRRPRESHKSYSRHIGVNVKDVRRMYSSFEQRKDVVETHCHSIVPKYCCGTLRSVAKRGNTRILLKEGTACDILHCAAPSLHSHALPRDVSVRAVLLYWERRKRHSETLRLFLKLDTQKGQFHE